MVTYYGITNFKNSEIKQQLVQLGELTDKANHIVCHT